MESGSPQPSARLTEGGWFTALTERAHAVDLPGVLSGHLSPGVLGATVVSRPRLTDHLDESALIVVTGPAGSGKSTLLCQWLASLPDTRRVGWLSLYPSHNSMPTFWMGMLAALRTADPDLLADVDPEIAVAAPDFVDQVLAHLDRIDERLIVVLDDFQVIDDPTVARSFARFAEEVAPAVTLAIGSRVLPRLHLARQRTRRPVVELTAADMTFTHEEVKSVLHERFGADADRLTDQLFEVTDGWAVMVALSTLIATDAGQLESLMRRGLAANRWLADFVIDELVELQEPDLRDFLRSTAFLAELNAPLCDAVRDRDDSLYHLDTLDHMGLLVAIDDRYGWWRHHHLVTEVLQRRTNAGDSDHLARRARAAEWLAAEGRHLDAVDHALAAERYDVASDSILATLRSPRPTRFPSTWFDALPDDVLMKDHELLEALSIPLSVMRNTAQLERLARLTDEVARRRANEARDDDDNAELERQWQVIWGGDVPAALAVMRALRIDEAPPAWRSFVYPFRVLERLTSGDWSGTLPLVDEALTTSEVAPEDEHGYHAFVSIAAHHLGDDERAEASRTDRDAAVEPNVVDLPFHWAEGLAAIRHGDLETSRRAFADALAWADSWVTVLVQLEEAEALARRGYHDEAVCAYEALAEPLRQLDDPGPLGTRVTELAGVLGRPALSADPVGAQAAAAGLSEREVEVLHELDSDASLAQIARRLHVSPNTIKSHTRALYRKLGLSGRDEAVATLRAWRGESS